MKNIEEEEEDEEIEEEDEEVEEEEEDVVLRPPDLPVIANPMVIGSPLSRSPSLLTLGSSTSVKSLAEALSDQETEKADSSDEDYDDLRVQASEEHIPEMVSIYRRKLSYVLNSELRGYLKDDFDKILTVKNKRLWRLSHHLSQNLKTITDYYRSQLDIKEYQLFLYRTKLKVIIKHMFDMAEKQENVLAREHFNHFLNDLLQAPPDSTLTHHLPHIFEESSLTAPSPSPGREVSRSQRASRVFAALKNFFCGNFI